MGLKVVTYEGSDNAGDTVFVVGGSRLHKGSPIAIPDEDAKLLKDVSEGALAAENHKFQIGNAAPKDAEHGSVVVDGEVRGSVPQPAARRAAAEAAAEDEADETPAATS